MNIFIEKYFFKNFPQQKVFKENLFMYCLVSSVIKAMIIRGLLHISHFKIYK